jgi:starch synthase
MDLLTRVAGKLLRNDVQLVVQVDGGGELVSDLEELWDRWPDRIQIRTGGDEAITHQLIGASDLFVVPTSAGPTTLLVLAAQRYGALPIASRRGPVADAIVDCDPELTTGSGFFFEEPTEDDLLAALRRGVAAFTKREAFEQLRGRTMRVDRSLDREARLYERLYRELTSGRGKAEASAQPAA